MSLVRTMVRSLPFPESIARLLVKQFGDQLQYLLDNDDVPDVAFAEVNPAKLPARMAESLLGRQNPEMIASWCMSRDKREGALDVVLRHWSLPVAEQCALASKALSDDTACAVLRNQAFADVAKLNAVPRARPGAVVHWLASHPSSLSDDEFLAALQTLPATKNMLDDPAVYNALYARRHLLGNILNNSNPQLALAACAFADDVDNAAAFERCMSETVPELRTRGLINLLDHPSLHEEVRVRAYAASKELGCYAEVLEAGCITPGSLLASSTPLRAISDVQLLDVLTARPLSKSTPARICQAADMVLAPAATTELVYRLSGKYVDQASTATARVLMSFATAEEHAIPRDDLLRMTFWAHQNSAVESDEQHRSADRAAHALDAPQRASKPSTRYVSYWGKNGDVYTAAALLDMPVESLPDAIDRYRSNDRNRQTCVGVLVSMLGDGSSSHSLECWERFFQLAQRATPNITLAKLAKSAVKLTAA